MTVWPDAWNVPKIILPKSIMEGGIKDWYSEYNKLLGVPSVTPIETLRNLVSSGNAVLVDDTIFQEMGREWHRVKA